MREDVGVPSIFRDHVKTRQTQQQQQSNPSKQKLTKTGVKLGSPRRASVYPLPARLAAWVLLI